MFNVGVSNSTEDPTSDETAAAEGAFCDAGSFCPASSAEPTTHNVVVVVQAIRTQSEYSSGLLSKFATSLASYLDVQASKVTIAVKDTTGTAVASDNTESSGTVNVTVTIQATSELIADSIEAEARPLFKTKETTHHDWALDAYKTPTITVVAISDVSINQDSIGTLRVREQVARLSTWWNRQGWVPSFLRSPTDARASSTPGSTTRSEAEQVAAATESPPAAPPVQPPPPQPSVDYQTSWKAVGGESRRGHLMWLLPVLAFLILSCCVLWCVVTQRTTKHAPREVADVVREGQQDGFVATIDQDMVEESKRRAAARRSRASANSPAALAYRSYA